MVEYQIFVSKGVAIVGIIVVTHKRGMDNSMGGWTIGICDDWDFTTFI